VTVIFAFVIISSEVLHNSTLSTERCSRHSASTASQLSQVIAAKLEDGNIQAAIRILSSEEGLVTPSEQSFSNIQQHRKAAMVFRINLCIQACQSHNQMCVAPFCLSHLALPEVQTACDLNICEISCYAMNPVTSFWAH